MLIQDFGWISLYIILKTIRNINFKTFTRIVMQEKTFFLENQETNQSQQVNFKIPKDESRVNLQKLLQKIPGAHKKIFKIYSPEKDQYISFDSINFQMQPYTISKDLLRLNVLIIKYTDNPDYLEEDEHTQQEDENKKQRSRERNIREVIQLVQKWREYHDNPPDGKRRTLQEASKLVGVSKKSLDDYYYQLRIGQKHDFDFSSHLDDKIGVLRAFIKTKEPERKAEGKNAKHPKKLKIIEEFTEKLKITQANSNSNSNSNSGDHLTDTQTKLQTDVKKTPLALSNSIDMNMNNIWEPMSEDQLFWGAPFTPLSQEKCVDFQQNFYDDFNFMLEDRNDPYLPFTDLVNKKSNISHDQF